MAALERAQPFNLRHWVFQAIHLEAWRWSDLVRARNGGEQHTVPKKLMKIGEGNPDHPVWRITAMIDATGVYGLTSYEYEWEREWRHIGNLMFEPEDVAFLFIPEVVHGQARAFFSYAYHENLGPAYFCPFIDAKWPKARVEEELLKKPLASPPPLPAYDEYFERVDLGNGRRVSKCIGRQRHTSDG
ncbi:hypothetical protein [Paraburkholderia sp. SIMBA_053]|uniref:hypothetical protein n=1 Tax=Paraburkholderia sp. SIMBA_053 TaxID=3085794 RepID=UPI00397B3A60